MLQVGVAVQAHTATAAFQELPQPCLTASAAACKLIHAHNILADALTQPAWQGLLTHPNRRGFAEPPSPGGMVAGTAARGLLSLNLMVRLVLFTIQ